MVYVLSGFKYTKKQPCQIPQAHISNVAQRGGRADRKRGLNCIHEASCGVAIARESLAGVDALNSLKPLTCPAMTHRPKA